MKANVQGETEKHENKKAHTGFIDCVCFSHTTKKDLVKEFNQN